MIERLDTEEKRKIARKYFDKMEWEELREATIKSRMLTAKPFLDFVKDPEKITKEDVRAYVKWLRKKGVTENTLRLRVLNLKKFLEFAGFPDLLDGFKPKKVKRKLPLDNVLNPEDIKEMVKYAKIQRDRAILMCLWDTGARVGELRTLRVRNVDFDSYGGTVMLAKGNGSEDGQKTGQRRIRIIDAVPDLQAWLNMHPYRNDPKAPLFPAVYDGKVNFISERRVDAILKYMKKKAEIQKDVSPHKIRHARLTHLAKQGLNEMELRIFAGWEDDSPMPAVYVHMAGGDVEKKLLKMAGIDVEEDREEVKSLEPVVCPRCDRKNPFDAKFCNCGQVLNVKAALEFEEVKDVLREELSVGERLLAKLEAFERMQDEMHALRKEVKLLRTKS